MASPCDQADMIAASMPYRLMADGHKTLTAEMKRRDADFYARLEKAGFKLDFGDDESGLPLKYYRRGSGYYIDVGASELICNGSIKMKQGQVERITPTGVKFTDGSELPGRSHCLCHGLRLDERLGRAADLTGSRRQGRQGLGPRLRHHEGSGSVGGRVPQHVETDPARRLVVPRRQPAPVAALLAVPVAAVEARMEGLPTPSTACRRPIT